MQLTFGSLFAEIGGFDLALERSGMRQEHRCITQMITSARCRMLGRTGWQRRLCGWVFSRLAGSGQFLKE